MREEFREQLDEALSEIDRPGSFCVSGSAAPVLPGLEVDGLGPVGLPLTAKQAKALIQRCDQAPYGKGKKTVVDPSVRRVWRLGPDRFALTNPDWGGFIATTIARVQEGLGLETQKLESHLYDLLLYEPGSFFLPHRDGEKLDRMVATLVVTLPSNYEGGELVVRHDGQERTIDFRGAEDNPFHIHFAAFYADCEHEIRPLRKGYRLCLVYNLALAKSRKKAISPPRNSEFIEKIGRLLRAWSEDDSARKLAITLEHQYTQGGISWDALKGVDRARAHILRESASQAGCRVYLALLTLWDMGQAEEDYGSGSWYGRRRRYDESEEDEEDQDEDEDVGGEYVMEEVYETTLTAAHWSDSDGHKLPIDELSIGEDEVLDPESLRDVKPEEEYEGYTGNEGMTLERWYRHGAIILWPERRHFETLCDKDSRAVVPELGRMIARWGRSKGKAATDLKAECLRLARAILAKWPEDDDSPPSADSQAGALMEGLAALDETKLIDAFLAKVMLKDISAEPGKSFLAACQKHGWETFQGGLAAVMKATGDETMERNVRLLEEIASARPGKKKEGWRGLCASLARELVSAIEKSDRSRAAADWRARRADRAEVLAGLARSLILTGQGDLLSRVAGHALATPKKYPLTSAQIPALAALRPWVKRHLKEPCPALSNWVASCRERLETITSRVPREPKDYRRTASLSCKCAECAALKRFLVDPKERVHQFRARQALRDHLEREIRAHHCDLDLKTDRSGSPHTLVCTKNTASYREALKTHQRDQEHLETVRAIEASLPA